MFRKKNLKVQMEEITIGLENSVSVRDTLNAYRQFIVYSLTEPVPFS